MSTDESPNRIHSLNMGLFDELASEDYGRRRDAIAQLPTELDIEELRTIEVLTGTAPGVEKRELKRKQILFDIGSHAIHYNLDLVTAENASQVFKGKWDIVGYFMLKRLIKKTKVSIASGEVKAEEA